MSSPASQFFVYITNPTEATKKNLKLRRLRVKHLAIIGDVPPPNQPNIMQVTGPEFRCGHAAPWLPTQMLPIPGVLQVAIPPYQIPNNLNQIIPLNLSPQFNGPIEQVWHNMFDFLFGNFPVPPTHKWVLEPVVARPLLPPHFVSSDFGDSAKVRFLCEDCGHGWTSMKGRVMFWCTFDSEHCVGYVFFKLFGQKCTKANCDTGNFQHAMWYPEEARKVVRNVFIRVCDVFYGVTLGQIDRQRRKGKPSRHHVLQGCQACAEGCCSCNANNQLQHYLVSPPQPQQNDTELENLPIDTHYLLQHRLLSPPQDSSDTYQNNNSTQQEKSETKDLDQTEEISAPATFSTNHNNTSAHTFRRLRDFCTPAVSLENSALPSDRLWLKTCAPDNANTENTPESKMNLNQALATSSPKPESIKESNQSDI